MKVNQPKLTTKLSTVISNRIGIPNFLIRAKQFNYKIKFHVSSPCLFSFYLPSTVSLRRSLFRSFFFFSHFCFIPTVGFWYGAYDADPVCLSGCELFLTGKIPLTKGYCRTISNMLFCAAIWMA